MEEYKRLYKLYQSKTDSELKEIIDPANGYTPMAVKVASDILEYGPIGCEETLQKSDGNISLPEASTETPAEVKRFQTPTWLIALSTICCLVTCVAVIFGVYKLTYTSNTGPRENNCINGSIYNGEGDYLGIIFYFYDENTFLSSTTSGTIISYGVYETNGNAITLGIASETYYAVSLNDGCQIMMNNSPLTKITDEASIKRYKELFSELDSE